MTPYKYVEAALGGCWVVENMAVVDEVPELLASGLPIWLTDETAILASLPLDQRRTFWGARVAALEGERALRRENPARTVRG